MEQEWSTRPSGFPGNFRKLKVLLGTLWVAPETLRKGQGRLGSKESRGRGRGQRAGPGCGAAGSDLDPRSGARVVLEQPGGCRGHLKRQLVEPLGKGALLLCRSQESFA